MSRPLPLFPADLEKSERDGLICQLHSRGKTKRQIASMLGCTVRQIQKDHKRLRLPEHPARQACYVGLALETHEALDKEAARVGTTKSALIRRAILKMLETGAD